MSFIKFKEDRLNIVLMINGFVGYEIAKYLIGKNEQISAVFIHEDKFLKYGEEIKSLFPKKLIYTADVLKNNKAENIISSIKPDILVTCYWNHLLKEKIFAEPKYGSINLHPGYLPYNRGWYANVWPFNDNSPAGVTIHKITHGADTGPIIAQEKTSIEPFETAHDLFVKQQQQMIDLFKETWNKLKETGIELESQNVNEGTYFKREEIDKDNEIDLDKKYTARNLINFLRSRSFKNKGAAYFRENGKKINVKVELSLAKVRDSK